jgi:hypothetical protein
MTHNHSDQYITPWFTTTGSVWHPSWASGCESWWAMLSQWLWIMVCNAEPVVVNHGVLCRARGCELWCITHHNSQPLAQHCTPWLTTTGSALHTIIHNYLLSIKPVVVNHGISYGASGRESWCIILSQWLLVMMCIAESVDVNHGLLCCASGCDWWWVMHTIIHNHLLSITHHDSQPLVQYNSP